MPWQGGACDSLVLFHMFLFVFEGFFFTEGFLEGVRDRVLSYKL